MSEDDKELTDSLRHHAKLTAAEAIAEIRQALLPEKDPRNCSKPFNENCILEAIKILDRTEEPEPVEPLDWPDSPGVWARDDCTFFVSKCLTIHLDGLWQDRNTAHLPGGWIKCTVTAPPVKEPEPIPEKPVILRAVLPTDGNEDWLYSSRESCYMDPLIWRACSTSMPFKSSELLEINESASDPEAVKLWGESRQADG